MYVPAHFRPSDAMIAELLADPGLCDLVTCAGGVLDSTPLPLVYADGRLTGHMGLVNPQWRAVGDGCDALVIVHGPDHYMSASWRPSGALIGGATVPTWNYLTLHVHGRLTVHQDEEWLIKHLGDVSNHYESAMEQPWSLDRVDPQRMKGQLRALVGLQIEIERVEAKAKLAQNLNEPERAAVVAKLRERGDEEGAAALEAAWASHSEAMHPWLRDMRKG